MRKSQIYEFVLAAMFAVIITICAWITIPFAIPFTMQTFGVFLTIAVLGGKGASISVFLYILLGIIGIPVFSGFQSGIGVLFSNTGGYVLGFLVATLLIWWLEKIMGKKTWAVAVQLFLGLLVCYGFGTIWFWILYTRNSGVISISAVLGICVIPFAIPDIVKILLVMAVRKRLRKVLHDARV